MTQDDFDDFDKALAAAWAFHKDLTPQQMSMAFTVLQPYPLAAVLAGLTAHARDPERGQYGPKPADVIFQIERHSPALSRPSADEAWAMCPRSEAETVVWTTETAEAWSLASRVDEYDRNGRRMAFKSHYDRLCGFAKAECRPVSWVVSMGHDSQQRGDVISEAVRLGRLDQAEGARLLAQTPAPVGLAQLEHLAESSSITEAATALDLIRAMRAGLNAQIDRDRERAREEISQWARAANALCERLEREAMSQSVMDRKGAA